MNSRGQSCSNYKQVPQCCETLKEVESQLGNDEFLRSVTKLKSQEYCTEFIFVTLAAVEATPAAFSAANLGIRQSGVHLVE